MVKGLLVIEKEKAVNREEKSCEALTNKDSGAISAVAGPGLRPLVAGIPDL